MIKYCTASWCIIPKNLRIRHTLVLVFVGKPSYSYFAFYDILSWEISWNYKVGRALLYGKGKSSDGTKLRNQLQLIFLLLLR